MDKKNRHGPYYACVTEECSYSGYKYQVRAHYLNHHCELPDIPFLCTECGFKTDTRMKAENHVLKTHVSLPFLEAFQVGTFTETQFPMKKITNEEHLELLGKGPSDEKLKRLYAASEGNPSQDRKKEATSESVEEPPIKSRRVTFKEIPVQILQSDSSSDSEDDTMPAPVASSLTSPKATTGIPDLEPAPVVPDVQDIIPVVLPLETLESEVLPSVENLIQEIAALDKPEPERIVEVVEVRPPLTQDIFQIHSPPSFDSLAEAMWAVNKTLQKFASQTERTHEYLRRIARAVEQPVPPPAQLPLHREPSSQKENRPACNSIKRTFTPHKRN